MGLFGGGVRNKNTPKPGGSGAPRGHGHTRPPAGTHPRARSKEAISFLILNISTALSAAVRSRASFDSSLIVCGCVCVVCPRRWVLKFALVVGITCSFGLAPFVIVSAR